jgi:hypothetical protein
MVVPLVTNLAAKAAGCPASSEAWSPEDANRIICTEFFMDIIGLVGAHSLAFFVSFLRVMLTGFGINLTPHLYALSAVASAAASWRSPAALAGTLLGLHQAFGGRDAYP